MGLMARPEELSFLFGGNAVFIAELYSRYVEDPDSVDPSWKSFFDDLRDDPAGTLVEARGPSWGRLKPSVIAGNGHAAPDRSEEHTSEIQSLMRISYAVFCLTTKNKKKI